jgi:plastocyanin
VEKQMKQQFGWVVAAVVVAGLGVSGCKSSGGPGAGGAGSAAAPANSASGSGSAAALDPATLGTVTGTVKLSGKAPAPVLIDTSMDPACGMSGGGPIYSEQYAVKNGNLGNVYIYVKSGPAAAMNYIPVAGSPVVMDQKGCRYTPHVVAVMRGGSVEFRNSDVTMHNVHTMPTAAGSVPIDISQGPKGAPQDEQFNHVEQMIPVRCNNHPWMNAFVNVSATPFFAVTGADGHFEIKGLPAGDYTLGAVQEKLGEQTIQVTVKPQTAAKADFSFSMK